MQIIKLSAFPPSGVKWRKKITMKILKKKFNKVFKKTAEEISEIFEKWIKSADEFLDRMEEILKKME